MKKIERKEIRHAVILFTIFHLVNFSVLIFGELILLHYLKGMLAGAAFCCVIIGLMPESAYGRIKYMKSKVFPSVLLWKQTPER